MVERSCLCGFSHRREPQKLSITHKIPACLYRKHTHTYIFTHSLHPTYRYTDISPQPLTRQPPYKTYNLQISHQSKMSYFRITLIRSAIGLPRRTRDVLYALGLKKRMTTVFYPVTQNVAGQIMKIKELVSVKEVDQPLTKEQVHLERKPDPGYYVERRGTEIFGAKRAE